MKILVLIVLCMTVHSQAFAKKMTLTENLIIQMAKEGTPEIKRIQSVYLESLFQEKQIFQKFSPEVFAQGMISETNERAILEFQPIFTPIKQTQLGFRQRSKFGVQASVSLSTDQRSTVNPIVGKIENATTTVLSLTAEMDLWKNLFGRVTKLEVSNARLMKKKAAIEQHMSEKAFLISLKRLYWSLVANEESTKISTQLLQTAKRQLKEASLRLKNAVAEEDEVAKYRAQLASREGTLLFLNYQRQNILKKLKTLLPQLDDVELGAYDMDETLQEVLSCTTLISSHLKAPKEFTQYDEIAKFLLRIKSQQRVINTQYDVPDVSLYASVKSVGVGSINKGNNLSQGSLQDSFSDQFDHNRTGFETGIKISVPFGETARSIRKVKDLLDEKKITSSIEHIQAQVESTHNQLSQSIKLLTSVIKAQKMSSEQLNKRLKIMEKKYRQARVSVDQLVFDQDALLNAELMTIETKLQILNTLLDYFLIFSETPCSFNSDQA